MAKLYFYYSAMNAGKTTTLLQSAHNYRERGMRVAILTPSLDAITLVPMFPHTLSARPLVINGDSTIRLRFSHRCSDLEISCDSQIALPIQDGEDVLIRRCDYHLNLIHPKDYSYFNTLSTKLGWSKKLF